MRRLTGVALVVLAVLALPAGIASASPGVDCAYVAFGNDAFVRFENAAGAMYRINDLSGAVRGAGVVGGNTFYAPVGGPEASALHVTVGGMSFLVERTDDLVWQ